MSMRKYETVVNAALYRARVWTDSDGARLQIEYVDWDGGEHLEKDVTYISERAALSAMRRFKKGANWRMVQ